MAEVGRCAALVQMVGAVAILVACTNDREAAPSALYSSNVPVAEFASSNEYTVRPGDAVACGYGNVSVAAKALADLNPGQHRLALVVTHRGSSVCQLSGFPQVELVGPVHPPESYEVIYQLPATSEPPGSVVLRDADTAHAVVTYLEPSEENTDLADPYVPDYIRVAVSSEALPFGLTWTFGPVRWMDGSTHPGNYVGPFLPGDG
ncbi:MAG: hypothetical protein QOI95_3055 [Acidimicrobiaceae bacterium]|jgi:hypothetical protein